MDKRRKLEGREGVLYLILFALALFVRVYKLGILPYGLHVDEAGMAYDAWSLANWGLDRYYKFYPVYFLNYGSGQSVLYGYCCALLMKFFEPGMVLYRIPAVVFGMLTWLFGSLLIRENIGRKEGLIGAALLAVCPFFVLTSRMGLDCYLFSGAAAVSLYLLTRAIRAEKKSRALLLYLLSGISFGSCLYTYILSWLVLPLFLAMTFLYLFWIHRTSLPKMICLGIPLGILAAPLLLMLAINTFDLPEIATAYITIPKLLGYRGAEVSFRNAINNIPSLVQAFFFYDDWRYNSVPTWFSMYPVSVPFAIAGMVQGGRETLEAVRKKKWSVTALAFFWLTAQIGMGLLIELPNVNKMNGVYFILVYFTVLGIKKCWNGLKSAKGKRIFAVCVGGLYVLFAAGFVKYYFTDYTEDTTPLSLFGDTYADILEEWAPVIGDKPVYVDCGYAYYALGEGLSPMEFQLVEQGDKERGQIHFDADTSSIDEDGFYLLFRSESFTEQLLEDGFKMEHAGKFKLLYK